MSGERTVAFDVTRSEGTKGTFAAAQGVVREITSHLVIASPIISIAWSYDNILVNEL